MSVINFFIHLRWHYQIAILSGGYLLALLFHPPESGTRYLLQFLNVHLLLFGGATAFNSYWDKDEGAIGGLQNPPPVPGFTRWAALGLMGIGQVWAVAVGWMYAIIYGISMILFWGYSSPLIRWKGSPWGSIIVIALSTGVNSHLLGSLAAGATRIELLDLIAAVGVGAVLVSLYPCSQIFQREEDRRRGDTTFAIKYGVTGVSRFFILSYSTGVVLIGLALLWLHLWPGILFIVLATGVGWWIYIQLDSLEENKRDYKKVMYIKYGTSISFVIFILMSWIATYYFNF